MTPTMRRNTIIILLLSALALYQYYQVTNQSGNDSTQAIEGLPWQIELLPQGKSRVFGVVLGQSTMADAFAVLGKDYELAIISMLDEQGALEAYYPRYLAGVLTGKLILAAQIDKTQLQAIRKRATRIDYTGSGAKKFRLHQDDIATAKSLPVATITFIPTTNFDEEIIMMRFGKPDRRIQTNDNTEHYLYRERGLDIIHNKKGKEVLQYVAPSQFNRLSDALN
ncbi:MAG TPA: hypothetical protein ENI64_03400 [Gammaproteobacteria bacterium]|nr:hypothetical protein [Gammaproteobacteria bacterium]